LGSDYYLAHVDAHTNLLRTTTQAMSAVLAGCDEVYIPAFDENANPSELGKRMARNIQLILKEESHFGKITDAASGSYYIEKLTEGFAEKAWEKFLEIESKGGLMKILESGYLNEILEKDRISRITTYQSGERVLLGVNKFQNEIGVKLKLDEKVKTLAKELEL
jgi:methylmalonyl-CoA mutase